MPTPTAKPLDVDSVLAGIPAGTIQAMGNPEALANGSTPTLRAMTLDDLDDDCPVCQANRAAIDAGDAPMVLIYE